MKKIKVLYIIDVLYGNGGTEVSLFRLLTHLDKKKFKVIVCPLEPSDSPMIRKMRENGIDVIPIPVNRIYGFKAFQQAFKLRKLIREKKIDIVQTIHFSSDVFGTIVAKWAGVATVISSRRDMGFKENDKRHQIIRRLINNFVDKTITNSKVMKHMICINENINNNKIEIIYNGLDVHQFYKVVDKQKKARVLGLDPDKLTVGVVANIRPIKGLEFFIQAAAKIVDIFSNIQFIVVGGDAISSNDLIVYKNNLKRLIEQLHLQNYIFFLGKQTDIAGILAIMDVYVLPSLSEGFSNTIIEAMAAGKSVVATNVGGNPEAVLHKETGFIVPSRDGDAIAQAVIELLKHKNLAKEMGQRGRLRTEKYFSITTMTKKMETLYISLKLRNDIS